MPRSQIETGVADWFGIKKLSWPLRFIAICFFLSIIALPIDVFPWIFPSSYTLRHRTFYPIAALCGLLLAGMAILTYIHVAFQLFWGIALAAAIGERQNESNL